MYQVTCLKGHTGITRHQRHAAVPFRAVIHARPTPLHHHLPHCQVLRAAHREGALPWRAFNHWPASRAGGRKHDLLQKKRTKVDFGAQHVGRTRRHDSNGATIRHAFKRVRHGGARAGDVTAGYGVTTAVVAGHHQGRQNANPACCLHTGGCSQQEAGHQHRQHAPHTHAPGCARAWGLAMCTVPNHLRHASRHATHVTKATGRRRRHGCTHHRASKVGLPCVSHDTGPRIRSATRVSPPPYLKQLPGYARKG